MLTHVLLVTQGGRAPQMVGTVCDTGWAAIWDALGVGFLRQLAAFDIFYS